MDYVIRSIRVFAQALGAVISIERPTNKTLERYPYHFYV